VGTEVPEIKLGELIRRRRREIGKVLEPFVSGEPEKRK